MDGIQVDLTAVAAIWMGGLLLLVPLIGVTLRYGVAPVLAIVAELRAQRAGGADPKTADQVAELRERLRGIEAELANRATDAATGVRFG